MTMREFVEEFNENLKTHDADFLKEYIIKFLEVAYDERLVILAPRDDSDRRYRYDPNFISVPLYVDKGLIRVTIMFKLDEETHDGVHVSISINDENSMNHYAGTTYDGGVKDIDMAQEVITYIKDYIMERDDLRVYMEKNRVDLSIFEHIDPPAVEEEVEEPESLSEPAETVEPEVSESEPETPAEPEEEVESTEEE